jgi:hypothetical protein
MRRGDLLWFLGVIAFALLFAELQVRREPTARWVVLAVLWLIASGLLIWTAYE